MRELNKMGTLYIIKNRINDKVYIGITTQKLRKRWTTHLRDAKIRNNHLYRAMRKYGIENFWIEPLGYYTTWSDLCAAERDTIAAFDSLHNGYNSTRGGEGTLGRQLSTKGKLAISQAQKGRTSGIPLPEDTKVKIRESVKAYLEDPNNQKKILERIESTRGRKQSAETKAKIANALRGHMVSEETRLKQKLAWQKRKIERRSIEGK